MKITLERLEAVDYTEATDHANSVERLVIGCIDAITDYLYSADQPEWKRSSLIQLEFTARAILDKYTTDLDQAIFGHTVELSDSEMTNISNIIANLGFLLGLTTEVESPAYNAEANYSLVNYDLQQMAREVYKMITGVLQNLLCQQTTSSDSISTV